MTIRTLLVALLGFAGVADAACPKWHSHVNTCTVAPAVCQQSITVDELPWGTRKKWAKESYVDTAQEACDKLWYWYNVENPNADLGQTALTNSNDPNIKLCKVWDNDLNDWFDNGSSVTYGPIGEPECLLTPAGPYTNPNRVDPPRPPVVPTAGGRFTDGFIAGTPEQRQWILESNFLRLGGYGSDLGWDDTASWITRVTYEPYNDDPIAPETPISSSWDGSLQVDHMLPRVDVFGCPCGTNGYNNALLISGKLNRQMSNDLKHPDRIKILQAHVPGYVAPFRAAFDEPTEASTEGETTGGCATTRASGMLAVLAVLLLTIMRRTRGGRASGRM
jgi:hypothetical protein